MNQNTSTSEYAIQILSLSKVYDKKTVVDKLELSVRKGELFSLLGENGAGKTTTIRMLCGLVKPTEGTAAILGDDIHTNLDAVKKVINISPQETAVAKHLSVRENLILMGGIYGLNKNQAREKADELLKVVGLEERAKDQARKLSGGMQRRLSIAMALVSDPKVLFLDEPTLGLDPQARRNLWKEIEKLKGKITIILTTHYLEEADALSDRIGIIDEGKIIALDTPKNLKTQFGGKQILRIASKSVSDEQINEIKKIVGDTVRSEEGIEIPIIESKYNLILETILKSGIKIKGIDTKKSTLDEVFLKLTEEGGDK